MTLYFFFMFFLTGANSKRNVYLPSPIGRIIYSLLFQGCQAAVATHKSLHFILYHVNLDGHVVTLLIHICPGSNPAVFFTFVVRPSSINI